MKTYKHLYPQITDFANLDEAWRKARRGKRGKEAAARFEENAEGEMFPGTTTTPTTGTTMSGFVARTLAGDRPKCRSGRRRRLVPGR